ncbi:LysR family transcriptional regulator [Rhizobium sp. MHM7A]|uniref:LysR family transcriptional regulator n=1 Tax=Rhizobium sp. MHM7A TaxID=2583233 RepID=UPI0032B15C53
MAGRCSTPAGVSTSMVSRRIEALEQGLGSTLFRRNFDRYELNQSGQSLKRPAEQAETSLKIHERSAREGEARIQIVKGDLLELLNERADQLES